MYPLLTSHLYCHNSVYLTCMSSHSIHQSTCLYPNLFMHYPFLTFYLHISMDTSLSTSLYRHLSFDTSLSNPLYRHSSIDTSLLTPLYRHLSIDTSIDAALSTSLHRHLSELSSYCYINQARQVEAHFIALCTFSTFLLISQLIFQLFEASKMTLHHTPTYLPVPTHALIFYCTSITLIHLHSLIPLSIPAAKSLLPLPRCLATTAPLPTHRVPLFARLHISDLLSVFGLPTLPS